MHDCLNIQEILAEIAGHCARGTNCTLARTCRAFYPSAMDVIWKSLSSFHPLIWCMPSELWAESSSSANKRLTFAREPTPAEWEAFRKHTHRVKSFFCREASPRAEKLRSKSNSLSFEVVDAISRFVCQLAQAEGRSASPLFPNLLGLTVAVYNGGHDPTGKLMKCVPFLGGTKLQKLCFGGPFCDLPAEGRTEVVPEGAIIPGLIESYPNLRSLDILKCHGGVIEYLMSLATIPALSASATSQDVHKLLSHLFMMPDLLDFRLQVVGEHADTHYNFGSAHIPPRRFATLVRITLVTVPVELAVQILDALSESQTLRAVCFIVDSATHDELARTLSKISAITTLDTIQYIFRLQILKLHYDDPPRITKMLLQELHRLPRLQTLSLSNTEGVEIDDDDLADLMEACPLLERLTITGTDLELPQPKITLIGLAKLRNTYPTIKSMEVPVSGLLPLLSKEQLVKPRIDPRLQPLSLTLHEASWCPETHPVHAARVLLYLFPQLRVFKALGWLWEEIGEVLGRLQRRRRQAQLQLEAAESDSDWTDTDSDD